MSRTMSGLGIGFDFRELGLEIFLKILEFDGWEVVGTGAAANDYFHCQLIWWLFSWFIDQLFGL